MNLGTHPGRGLDAQPLQSRDRQPGSALDPRKFRDPSVTADGQARASVALRRLETLWFNTGTLCNLECAHCYIESSPRNDRLVYLSAAEVGAYLDELEGQAPGPGAWGPVQIGFTGGEPFLNPQFVAMLEDALRRGHRVLVLTNAMRPLRRREVDLLRLRRAHGERLTLRVSVDHPTAAGHEAERGPGSWAPTLDGLRWLAAHGFGLSVAGRLWDDDEAALRDAYARLFAAEGLPVDAADPAQLVLFPEMDARVDVPEITTACWGILGQSPDDVMCASSRMVVKRRGAAAPAVVSCTLLPYDEAFELGATLAAAAVDVPLNHPHCARFCVLGGASCAAPAAVPVPAAAAPARR